ncbi:Protein CBG27927 [Caenorhabditis briggsae]|uniref:Protein CBG27927 n=1 Tax=Caenorhabditis briggsae TaxID=6238 RepID=B6IJL9_CAEBR|nr:Protein CBG27927 [Caenorhabditis briggsae]CAS00099.1 Protein CBG27927 [Caenorhabditis briggsae]
MSLRDHLRLYHGSWMLKTDELNDLFYSRPPVTFTVYPEEEEVTGRPGILEEYIWNVRTKDPETGEMIRLTEYFRVKFGYKIKHNDEFPIFLDDNTSVLYPPEVLYVHDIGPHEHEFPNPFTVVV